MYVSIRPPASASAAPRGMGAVRTVRVPLTVTRYGPLRRPRLHLRRRGVSAGLTEQQVYQQFLASGQLNPPGYTAPPPQAPGFNPSPVVSITVPPSTNTLGGTYKSLESGLQQQTAALANSFATQGMTDAEVAQNLTDYANGQCAYLGTYDPSCANIGALVAKYTAAYRAGVTPAAPSASVPPQSRSSPWFQRLLIVSSSPTEGLGPVGPGGSTPPAAPPPSSSSTPPPPASSTPSGAVATTTGPFDFLSNPITIAGMSFPLWGLAAAGVLAVYLMGGHKR